MEGVEETKYLKNKNKFSQRHESSNPKYNMIIEQEKNKRKTKINVYIALSHWSLLLALQNIKETAEIGKTTRGKREINYWGEKNKDEITNNSRLTVSIWRHFLLIFEKLCGYI